MSNVEALLDQASSQSGFTDFGEMSFREGLERLVDAAEQQANLSAGGRKVFYDLVRNSLVNRLEIEDWYSRYPEIDEQEIERPLIGLGLPRTGSTAFFQMLSMDRGVRTIRNWEGLRPCPPPIYGQEGSDPRVIEAVKRMEERDRANPKLKTMLPSTAISALECGIIMSYEFKSNFYSAMMNIPSYSNWLRDEADMVTAYRYLKRVLKLLQWRCPPTRWRLKSPPHSMFIKALDQVFPDARFWMTHRDICKLIPSVADLYAEQRKRYSDNIDKNSLGRFNIEFWDEALKRMLAFRDGGNEHRFFDVYFDEFQANPFPSIARLYDYMGEELTPETESKIAVWREASPKGKHGEHAYDAADYGIDLHDLRDRFAFYNKRFNL